MRTRRSLDAWLETTLSRRSLLLGGLALSGLPLMRGHAQTAGPAPADASPFTLGVASGDPTPDGVVLWTRLAPDPLRGGGMSPAPVEVRWEIALDDRMARIVREGRVSATSEWGHSVHVEADGLEPDRWYWYRFRTGNTESPIGRTRTLPRRGAAVDRLRFAFCSCQHYENGYFTAYRHMAGEDLDLVFHLGDYIYEYRGTPGRTREHVGGEILTLDDYRTRYAQYKSDPDLQAAHAAFPWIVTWDDHEVDNNYSGDISERTDPRDLFLLRRAAAYQAYYEHMPLRRASIPAGPALQLYRGLGYGALASFFVLDTRQYRTDQPCGDGSKAPCEGVRDPAATLMGRDQSRWLLDGLDRSRVTWNVVPQQVMMARVDQLAGPDERYSMDQWSAYEAERTRLLEFLRDRRPANPIVLTGDIHSNWVNDLKVNFADAQSPAVATEFVGTSISSGGDGVDLPARAPGILAENPFVKFHNTQRGYVSCEMTPKTLRARYQIVDYVSRPGAPLKTRATFVVEDGKPGAVSG
jgi:alkaline phosphatase D